MKATPSALTASAPWWWEEDLDLSPSATVSSLTATITVARTSGIAYSGFYTNAPGGALALSHSVTAGAVVYRATLNSGQTLSGNFRLGAQFKGNGTAHSTSGDTFHVTATVGGRVITTSGHF